MVEKFWPQEELKEEKFYQHRSQVCDLFLYLLGINYETIYFFEEQFRIWKCI